MSLSPTIRRSTTSVMAALAIGIAGMAAIAPAATAEDSASNDEPVPVPAAGASESEWEEWASAETARAQAFDWAADSAARGCELVSVDITQEVDADFNESMGAPADLQTFLADRLENCDPKVAASLVAESTPMATTSSAQPSSTVPRGTRCVSSRGPGTICIHRTGGMLSGSWLNSSGGNITGYLRLGRITVNSTACPGGTHLMTGPTSRWNSGQTRTISRTQGAGTYSVHMWQGNSRLGATCAQL